MDLGDFIPEDYKISFSIKGSKYRFAFAEASVDEVLKTILKGEATDIPSQRAMALAFLQSHIAEGDKDQLAKDFALLPFQSKREALDVLTIISIINGRVKKNETGDQEKETTAPRGSRATSRS